MEDEYNHVNAEDEYTQLIMYKICPKNKNIHLCYVGQTANFDNRRQQHIKNTYCISDKKHYHLKQYEAIRQNGGWDEWEMIEIEKFNCKSNLEARMREQELIIEHGANLNSVSAYISEEERAQLKKQITEKYRQENKELLKEQTKKYKQDHKEIIAEQMKKYREEHKQQIYEKKKEYIEKNKEQYKENQLIWREKNKEILKEKRKIATEKKKQEKLEQQALIIIDPKVIEEERLQKEQLKKEKREQYNAERRLKRAQEKEKEKENENVTGLEKASGSESIVI
jgi:hypothetical protein